MGSKGKERPMRRGTKAAKAKVDARAPVARKSPKNEGSRIDDLEKRLAEALKREAEALEQQAATSQILAVISTSPTHIQPVLDSIAESAARLCGAFDAAIFRGESDRLRLVAHHGPIPLGPMGEFTVPLNRGTGPGRSVVDGRPVHIADLQAEVDEFPEGSELARQFGFRTSLNTPLMREGVTIGTITLRRIAAQLFTEREIALLQTFADQAGIAIENVRLFTELQARNRELTEALGRETATSEILRVISSSPTDIQPVLDAVAESAARLCTAYDASIRQLHGDVLRLVAHHGPIPNPPGLVIPVIRGTVAGRTVLDRQTVHVADLQAEAEEFPEGSMLARELGHRTMLSVPLLRDGLAIGVIGLRRTEIQPFTDKQIALLQTFADQAVIAIENVRLFNETKEALERQTATADILRVISSSPTDARPVFEAIVESAVRLMGAVAASVYEFDGTLVHLRTLTPASWPHADELRRQYPRPPDVDLAAGRVILERAILHLADVQSDPATPPVTRQVAERMGLKSVVGSDAPGRAADRRARRRQSHRWALL
jgi:two-component system NtrC family sensor kinase